MLDDSRADRVADEEILYRRVPMSTGWYDPNRQPPLEPEAFRPTREDTTGISVVRAKYASLQEAARGRPGKSYHVALLRAGDLRAAGMEVMPKSVEGRPGHAEITSLTYGNRRSDQALEWQSSLAGELCLAVEGPFLSPLHTDSANTQNGAPGQVR
jgi:hypothetical protein